MGFICRYFLLLVLALVGITNKLDAAVFMTSTSSKILMAKVLPTFWVYLATAAGRYRSFCLINF